MDQIIANQQYKYIVHCKGKWIAYDGTKFVCSADANADAVVSINENLSLCLLRKIVAANARVVDIGSAVYTHNSHGKCEHVNKVSFKAPIKASVKASIEDKIYSFLDYRCVFRYPDYIETAFVNCNARTADEVMRDYADAVADKSIDIYVIWTQLRGNINLLKKIIAVFRILVSLGRFAIDVIIYHDDDGVDIQGAVIIDDAACVFDVYLNDEEWDAITVRNEIIALVNNTPANGSYRKIKTIRTVIEKCHRTRIIDELDSDTSPHPFRSYDSGNFVACGRFRYTEKFKIIGEDDEYQRIVHDAMRSAFNNVVKNAYGIIKTRVAAVMDNLAANDN